MGDQFAAARRLLHAPSASESDMVDALFRREASVEPAALRATLGAGGVEALFALGLVVATDRAVEATARLTRFGGQLVASDRMGFRNHAAFVLAPGPATATLADAVRPLKRGRALDLGCGPGSLALWLAGRGMQAIGVDVSDRALAFAGFNRQLNALPRASFQAGDFLTAPPDPGLDERFDICVANPPFVLAPRSTLVYRDGPLPGDETTRVALERVARTLASGGRGYVIGSWADDGRERWDARPRGWLGSLRARAIVTRISSVDPDSYVRSWTRDADDASPSTVAEEWRAYLSGQGIRRITTGVIAIAAPARRRRWSRAVIQALEIARPGWRVIEAALAGR